MLLFFNFFYFIIRIVRCISILISLSESVTYSIFLNFFLRFSNQFVLLLLLQDVIFKIFIFFGNFFWYSTFVAFNIFESLFNCSYFFFNCNPKMLNIFFKFTGHYYQLIILYLFISFYNSVFFAYHWQMSILTLFRMGYFRAAHGWGWGVRPKAPHP